VSDKKDIILEMRAVSKSFVETKTQALESVTLSITAGEFVVIRGSSGSGKSTILNMLAGLIPPTSGEVFFRGNPLSKIRDKSRFRRDNIGFIFQDFYLYPGFTVLENVVLPISNKLFISKEWISKAKGLLDYLSIGEKSKQNVNTLSSGERQRVCIARALLNDPELILADEPTGCLDSKNADNLLLLLKDIHKNRSTTIVMVTHDDHVAEYSDRQVKIMDGKLGVNQ
jgi:putative ABC transport system ATP-binding protein